MAAGHVDTVVPLGSVKVWFALPGGAYFQNRRDDSRGAKEVDIHSHVRVNGLDCAVNCCHCTIHNRLSTLELQLADNSVGFEVGNLEAWTSVGCVEWRRRGT